MSKQYNLDKLVKITFNKERKAEHLKYFPEKKYFFGIWKEKEGIYGGDSLYYYRTGKYSKGDFYCNVKNIPNDFYISKSNEIYEKAYIELRFVSNIVQYVRFESDEKALEYISNIKKQTNSNFLLID